MMFSSKSLLQAENLQIIHEELFTLLLESKEYSIIKIDATGHVISWNSGAENMYGYLNKDVIGKHIEIFFANDELYKREPWINLEKATANGRYEQEGWMHRKDGSMFYGSMTLTALYNDDKTINGFATMTRDVSVQKKLEDENEQLTSQLEEKVKQRTKELEIVNKELEAFSYSVSHDLRAPLRAVSGFSMMLKEDYESQLDSEGNRIIDKIIENSRLMGQLIDDLLSFSKMARLEVLYDSIDMNQLVDNCLSVLLHGRNDKDYSIKILELPASKGDPNMLRQVWHNLLGNALKYTSKTSSPQIEIGFTDNVEFNTYYVKDNGSGFNMKYADKLFGVFQRLHRQDEFEGTGLGLALAKRIVSKHLGEIWGEGSVGNGATFYFSIPKQL